MSPLRKVRRVHVLGFVLFILLLVFISDLIFSQQDVGILDLIRVDSSIAAVIIKNADDPRWKGRSQHVGAVLERLIAISREKNIFDESVLPIHVHVNARARDEAAAYRIFGKSFITISTHYIWRDSADDTLAHEIAHLLTSGERHSHVWQSVCAMLFDEYHRQLHPQFHIVDVSNCFPP